MPPRKSTAKASPKACPSPSPARARLIRVSHLRIINAAITPCQQTQAQVSVAPVDRAMQMLASFPPVLAEHSDGTLEPRGYARTVAALLQVVAPEHQVWCLVYPESSAPAVSPLPLVLEFDRRLKPKALRDVAQELFTYWRAKGITHLSQEDIAAELSVSANTLGRHVGKCIDLAPVHNLHSEELAEKDSESINEPAAEENHNDDVKLEAEQVVEAEAELEEAKPDEEAGPDFPTTEPSYEEFPTDLFDLI